MAWREVDVSDMSSVYSIERSDDEAKTEQSLSQRLQGRWSLPTVLAFLAWFVFAPQCISTIAVARRETNGWRWPMFMVAYLFALAYIFAGITFWTATRSEEHTSELQALLRISYAVFCLNKKKIT